MPKSTKAYRKPTHEEITARAQRIYEAEGRPEGKAMEHWLRAETEITAQLKAEAAAAKTPKAPALSPAWETPTSQPRQGLHRN